MLRRDPYVPFLGVGAARAQVADAAVAVLPVPYEGTVSWGRGTAAGPRAILEASQQVELYDEVLQCEPFRRGIATLPPLTAARTPAQMVARVYRRVRKLTADGRLVAMIGGEHSITPGAVRACLETYPRLGVIQFDAHADLRETYDGSKWNHACVMARVREVVPNTRVRQVGVRSLSAEEAERIRRQRYRVAFAHKMREQGFDFQAFLKGMPREVYVTFDVDVFDGSVIRATGTPEPGGLGWGTVTDLLAAISRTRRIVGFDVVELSGKPFDAPSAFAAAKLVHRLIGLCHTEPSRETCGTCA